MSVQLEATDPSKHFVILGPPTELSEQAFVEEARAASQPGSVALLFVHGYNTGFKGAVFRTAQLGYDLHATGPVFLYSWPSRKEVLAYDYDVASADQAQVYFESFLRLISERAGVKKLNIIAHSRGNNLVLTTLARLAREQSRLAQDCCGQLILASPDVDSDYAANLLPELMPLFEGVTLYANQHDRALLISQRKAGGVPRAGQLQLDGAPLILRGLDSIDASQAFRPFELNHDTYVTSTTLFDIEALIERAVRPPDLRTPSLRPIHAARGDYWRLMLH